MAASDKPTITFYDILLDPAAYPMSPNPWKARYALNFAGVPYRTTWVPLNAIASTRAALHLPANRKHMDGSDFPTLPIIRNPLASSPNDKKEVIVGDSFDIALHLNKTYQPALFPLSHTSHNPDPDHNDPATIPLHLAFNKLADDLFTTHGAPLAGVYMPLDPRTAEADKAAMAARFPGGNMKWEDFEIPRGTEQRKKALRAFEVALEEKLAPCWRVEVFEGGPGAGEGGAAGAAAGVGGSGGEGQGKGKGKGKGQGQGPFMGGRARPMYADFIVGGWLQFMRGCLPEWGALRDEWSGGVWGRLFDALEEWAAVDGREGVAPARR